MSSLAKSSMVPSQRKKQTPSSARSAGRPKTACHQCSSLKIRCTGEKPSCFRCRRLRRPCTWPQNRKYPAAGQTIHVNTSLSNASARLPGEPQHGKYGIPHNLLQKLLDVYFHHVYNASLLFHRPSFIESVADGTANKFVVLSICAMASCFYIRDENSCENPVLQDGIAHEWAIEAGKLVFSEVETPTEDNLITFLTLGLFWSSQNDWKRLEIYSAATSGTFRALGLPASARLYDRSVRAELSRRRIWACFIVSQFSNWIDNLAMDIEDLKDIPMPSDGLDFETENIQGDSQIPAFFVHDRGTGGLFAELIRISCIWSSVCRLAHNDKMIMDEKLPLIQKLSSELKEWKKGLPKCVDCSYASSGETVKQAQALTVHLIYHQTMCTLHSSIIPLFSFQPQEDGYGLFKSVSAQTALYHARQISTMFIQSSNWIGSFATGFMGYAAYCSTAVQIPFLWCQKESVRENARTNIIANLDALKAIGRHWKLIALLVEYVPLLYRYHKKMAYSLSDEPHSLDETDLDRHQGRRVAARTSILGYNKVVQYRSQHQGSNETAKLELDFDDDREKADEDFQLSPNDPVAASAEVDSFDVNTDELLDGLYFEELFSGTTEMASADQYVSFFSQIDGSSFDAEQQLLLSSMDFPGML